MNEVLNTIKQRKSVRKFLSTQLKDDEIKAIVEAGIEAPSGHNTQPVRYIVVQNQELIEVLNRRCKEEMAKSDVDWINKFGSSEKYHLMHHAPTIIIVLTKDDALTPIEDASAAIENMLVAATSLGIGSVWVALMEFYFKLDEAKKTLGIKDGFTARYVVCLGYENKEKIYNKIAKNYDVIEWVR